MSLPRVTHQRVAAVVATTIPTEPSPKWVKTMPADVATTFKVHEVAKYHTLVGFGSFVTGFLTINLDTWNSLPKEVQEYLR